MFFWQTAETVEAHETVADLPDANLDVAGGMIYANLIFYFIILTAAAVLTHLGGIDTVASAAAALRPVAGSAATALFAVGIVTSGILSVPVMAASSAYGLCEIFGWHEGLDRKVRQARGFYVLLGGSLVLGAAIGLLRVPPVALMFWSQVLNGVVLAPLVAVLILLSNDRRVVHQHRSHPVASAVGWGTVALTTVLAALTIWQLAAGG
jgi:Mn2+/Fe2+ NRAMP family transporter